jgi:hypothetical protein
MPPRASGQLSQTYAAIGISFTEGHGIARKKNDERERRSWPRARRVSVLVADGLGSASRSSVRGSSDLSETADRWLLCADQMSMQYRDTLPRRQHDELSSTLNRALALNPLPNLNLHLTLSLMR